MNVSDIEKVFQDLKNNPANVNLSEDDIIKKGVEQILTSDNFSIEKFLKSDGEMMQAMAKQMQDSFASMAANNQIIEKDTFIFGGIEGQPDKLIVSQKLPQLIVDKSVLLLMINELRAAVTLLESKEEKRE